VVLSGGQLEIFSIFKVSIQFIIGPKSPFFNKPVPRAVAIILHHPNLEGSPDSGPCQRVASPARAEQPSFSRIFCTLPEVPVALLGCLACFRVFYVVV